MTTLILKAVAPVAMMATLAAPALHPVAASTPDDPVLTGRAAVLSLEAAPIQGCVECIECGAYHHLMDTTLPLLPWQGSPSPYCQYGDCTYALSGAMPCQTALSAQELGQLWVALRTFEGQALAFVMADYDEYVTFNEERLALQVESCGAVVAHVPLTEARAMVLRSSQSNMP